MKKCYLNIIKNGQVVNNKSICIGKYKIFKNGSFLELLEFTDNGAYPTYKIDEVFSYRLMKKFEKRIAKHYYSEIEKQKPIRNKVGE